MPLRSEALMEGVLAAEEEGMNEKEGLELENEEDEPDKNMEAAAEVVEAMGVADEERACLCFPSYVVIRTDVSFPHICT